MDKEEVARLRALCEAATPGPWGAEHYGGEAEIEFGRGGHIIYVSPEHIEGLRREDLAFIAAAREALPALLDEVERLRGVVESLPQRLNDAGDDDMRGQEWLDGFQAAIDALAVSVEEALNA